MSKQTIQLVGIGIIIILGGVVLWQMISVNRLNGSEVDQSYEIDYAQLERSVELWKSKEPFSFVGVKRATPSAETESEGEQIETEIVIVSVRNGTGEAGIASDIADQIKAIEGVEVSSVGNAKETVVTSLTHKESVSVDIINDILALIEPTYGTPTVSTLSDNAEYDVVVTIGSQEE